MANLVRYYFRKLGANFVDFKLDYPNSNLSLIGSDVVYVGSSGVDRVYVAKGVKFTFNNSGTGIDEIYLGGSLADYSSDGYRHQYPASHLRQPRPIPASPWPRKTKCFSPMAVRA